MAKTCDVRAFGAKGDGTTKDTVTALSHGTNFSATWKHA